MLDTTGTRATTFTRSAPLRLFMFAVPVVVLTEAQNALLSRSWAIPTMKSRAATGGKSAGARSVALGCFPSLVCVKTERGGRTRRAAHSCAYTWKKDRIAERVSLSDAPTSGSAYPDTTQTSRMETRANHEKPSFSLPQICYSCFAHAPSLKRDEQPTAGLLLLRERRRCRLVIRLARVSDLG